MMGTIETVDKRSKMLSVVAASVARLGLSADFHGLLISIWSEQLGSEKAVYLRDEDGTGRSITVSFSGRPTRHFRTDRGWKPIALAVCDLLMEAPTDAS